jgi:hypothetical protein
MLPKACLERKLWMHSQLGFTYEEADQKKMKTGQKQQRTIGMRSQQAGALNSYPASPGGDAGRDPLLCDVKVTGHDSKKPKLEGDMPPRMQM